MKEKYKVDPTRFYATGQSAGSMASQGFGLTNPEWFAAIASTSGLMAPGGIAAATAQLATATYGTIPTYAITGQGDMGDMVGDLWDPDYNNLDIWAAYYLKANGVGPLGDGLNVERNGRFSTWTWKNEQGFPLVKWTKTAWRAHNNIPAEMPMLWDFLKLWSYKDGVRYYGGVPLKSGLKALHAGQRRSTRLQLHARRQTSAHRIHGEILQRERSGQDRQGLHRPRSLDQAILHRDSRS